MAPPSSRKRKFKSELKQNRKLPKKSDDNGETHASELSLHDEDEDFPRGGGNVMNKEKRAKAMEAGGSEINQGAFKRVKKEKKPRNRNMSADNDNGSLFSDGVFGKFPRFANKITLKNVSPGMKLWGVVAEVNEKDMVVSLPGGLRGIVRASDAVDKFVDDALKADAGNDFLSRIYKEGQLVSCTVLKVDDKKDSSKLKIWLSLRLSLLYKSLRLDAIQEGMVLNAYIKSIEDHGFILHFGLPSFTGFMPIHSLSDRRNVESCVGEVVQGVVTTVDKAQMVIHLSSDPGVIMKFVTKELSGISIDTLSPGMMVSARVISVLENGIMLSFLSYFTGTVDIFNLNNTFPPSSWKNDYPKNVKVNARILFIDPSTRAVGLTMNPYLIANKAPQCLVKIGDIFDEAKVVRVDKAFGLLVELPTVPCKTPAFVSVADLSDKSVVNWDANYKEGSMARLRVLGYRHLEGLAIGAVKASALEGLVFTHADMKPGMIVKGKIAAVQSYGAIVQFDSGVKALCPLRHMSELERMKPPKKFQVGVELVFRVLGCRSKRISVTHKRTLVKSKLPILCSYADATDGLVTHGWITKIESHGCFVRFYNGVEGYAPRSELGLEPGNDIGCKYHVEQVVKCRVIKGLATSCRIGLTFNVAQSRMPLIESLKPGAVVSGVCEYVTSQAVSVSIEVPNQARGTITIEHLSDHHGLATTLMSVMKPGHHFDELLVLDVKGSTVVLSAKYSLIRSSKQLPSEISDINLQSVMPGYICNIIEAGCFVRFLGNLTGFAPKNKATDDRSSSLLEIFYVGQSVRCSVVNVNAEVGRVMLSLKQSLCCSIDTSFIQEYFLLEEKIAQMQAIDTKSSGLSWSQDFGVGHVIKGTVLEVKDVGVLVNFEKYNDVYGFISHNQMTEANLEVNSVIEAVVLDVSKIDRIVDLSLKPDLLSGCKEESSLRTPKKRKKEASRDLEVNQIVDAVVEIVKENYLVLSLPNHKPSIGHASRDDYNTQKLPPKQFSCGQRVSATVMSLPAPSTGERLLLLLSYMGDDMENSRLKRARKKSFHVGSVLQVEITEIKPFEARVKFGSKQRGRIHITETAAENSCDSPFGAYKVGQTVRAVIVSGGNKSHEGRGGCQWELSIKPSLLEGSPLNGKLPEVPEDASYVYGQHIVGFVYKVDTEWVWLAISRDISAKLHILDSSCEPSELADFQNRFYVGQRVYAYIASLSKEKKLMRVTLIRPAINPPKFGQDDSFYHIDEGNVIGGRIFKILSGVGGVLVQVGPHHYGKVHFMELADSWVPNPLCGYQEGQFVKCKVLEVYCSDKGTVHVDLSLCSASASSPDMESTDQSSNMLARRVTDVKDILPNMVVKGYVKSISNKGCFIMLSRNIDAKILISNLSDNYVEHPEKEFPVGTLVMGRVLSVETLSKRVEVTLRTSIGMSGKSSNADSLDDILVGSVVSGRIKRVEAYGLFIFIDGKNAVGLCHVSEISDCQREDLDAKYSVGQNVTVKILKVDKDRNRVSLGMKSSYLMNEEEFSVSEEQIRDPSFTKKDSISSADIALENDYSVACIGDSSHDIPAVSESRALVPPLEVPLDDVEDRTAEGAADEEILVISAGSSEEKTPKRGKKGARSQREVEIRAAEERLRKDGIPRNTDEFEKLVRSSPNSSFIWIKYMEFMLSLADVGKARSIAERALQTINIREESEKLNVWVAYFNIENEYGSPPEEAVNQVFQRALQTCDPKKLHLALLGIYEATKQHDLANCLLDKMTKAFKHSCKVWLRKVEYLLKTNSNEIELVVKRAAECLPHHKQLKFRLQTAIREFKLGVPDRGRSMFENILKNHPKRTDVWSIYLDREIHLGDQDLIRSLFERATSLSLPPKKMKFLFNKYLKYEQSVGDEEREELVKKKAMEYVESRLT